MRLVRVGGIQVPYEDAVGWVRRYLTDPRGSWAYPAYDTYRSGSGTDELSDADLLAPSLLNAGSKMLRAYYSLQDHRDELQRLLCDIPSDVALADDDADPVLIGRLYSILDRTRLRGVRGTVLAKVLHRKRPSYIPLYDRYIRHCYFTAPAAPLAAARREPWQAYMTVLAEAIRQDLRTQREVWSQIIALASAQSPITPLRGLDIVAWSAGGGQPSGARP
jgi:hypothetical protein